MLSMPLLLPLLLFPVILLAVFLGLGGGREPRRDGPLPARGIEHVTWEITANAGFLAGLRTVPAKIRVGRGQAVAADASCRLLVDLTDDRHEYAVRVRAWHTALPIVLYDSTVEACEGLRQLQAYLAEQHYQASIPQCPMQHGRRYTGVVRVARLSRWVPPGKYRLDLSITHRDSTAANRTLPNPAPQRSIVRQRPITVFALQASIPVH